MDLEKFSKISESLRQYRRAELRDFEVEIGTKPIDQLYVDPLLSVTTIIDVHVFKLFDGLAGGEEMMV